MAAPECMVCIGPARDPVVLHCRGQHVICFGCVFDMYRQDALSKTCPACRGGDGGFTMASRWLGGGDEDEDESRPGSAAYYKHAPVLQRFFAAFDGAGASSRVTSDQMALFARHFAAVQAAGEGWKGPFNRRRALRRARPGAAARIRHRLEVVAQLERAIRSGFEDANPESAAFLARTMQAMTAGGGRFEGSYYLTMCTFAGDAPPRFMLTSGRSRARAFYRRFYPVPARSVVYLLSDRAGASGPSGPSGASGHAVTPLETTGADGTTFYLWDESTMEGIGGGPFLVEGRNLCALYYLVCAIFEFAPQELSSACVITLSPADRR